MAVRGPFGAGEAQLSAVVAELRNLATGIPVTRDLRRELAATARPLAPMVRAAIMNIPSAGGMPYGQPPGLRARIANCVVPWAYIHGNTVSVGVEIDASRMPDGQKALPLYMEGEKRPWRHPLFGNRERWYDQEVPAGSGLNSHPYFEGATNWFGPAGKRAIERVLENIEAKLNII
jgi:hypothetical protein